MMMWLTGEITNKHQSNTTSSWGQINVLQFALINDWKCCDGKSQQETHQMVGQAKCCATKIQPKAVGGGILGRSFELWEMVTRRSWRRHVWCCCRLGPHGCPYKIWWFSVKLFAGCTQFMHFCAILNCILQPTGSSQWRHIQCSFRLCRRGQRRKCGGSTSINQSINQCPWRPGVAIWPYRTWRHQLLPVGIYRSSKRRPIMPPPTALGQILVVLHFAWPTVFWASCCRSTKL